jgi:hypothetical protein
MNVSADQKAIVIPGISGCQTNIAAKRINTIPKINPYFEFG